MSMIICKECGKEYSNARQDCPHCAKEIENKRLGIDQNSELDIKNDIVEFIDVSFPKVLFSIRGRINRMTYFVNSLLISIVSFWSSSIIDSKLIILSDFMIGIFVIVSLLLAYWGFVLVSKRLHDFNVSAWYCLLCFVPLVNIVLGLYLLFKPGDASANKYGNSSVLG